MSTGYTPLFGSLTRGTLCGRWPDIGLWPVLLSMADKNGVIDATHAYIAGVTGLPVSEVEACISRFCQQDPLSRSSAEGGARLVLLDSHRNWGWQVVNFAYYREKARLMSQRAAQVADGRNAEKVRRYKERHPQTPADTRGHPPEHTDTLSNANADSNSKNSDTAQQTPRQARSEGSEPPGFAEIRKAYPRRSGGQRWGDAQRFYRKRLSEGEAAETILEGVKRYASFARITGIERTAHVQQAATFLGENRGYLEPWEPPPRAETATERIKRLNGSRDEQKTTYEHEIDEPRRISSG